MSDILKEKSVEQLQALAYQQMIAIKQFNMNLQAIESEIASRPPEAPSVPEEEKEE